MHFVYLYNFLTNVVACIFYIGMEMSTVKVAGCIFFVCQEPQPGPVVVKCLTTNWQQTELTVVKYKYMYNQAHYATAARSRKALVYLKHLNIRKAIIWPLL